MLFNILVPFLIFSAIYGLVILGLILTLRVAGISARWRIVLGFLIFGTATGLLVAQQWPQDNIFLYNLYAHFLGYAVYLWAIQHIGNPTASNAHDTIPWLLRIPQVFVIVSVIFWGSLGLLVQFAVNRPRLSSIACVLATKENDYASKC